RGALAPWQSSLSEDARTELLLFFLGLSGIPAKPLPHQHVPELPRVAIVDVFRKQPGAVGQRGPVGVKALHRAEIGQLDLEAATEIHLVGLDDATGGIFQR